MADTTIIGGYDEASADEVAKRAGQTSVVRASRGLDPGQGSEQVQMLDVLPVSDQQQVAKGEAIIIGRGLKPFLGYVQLIFERGWRYCRRIAREASEVNTIVTSARQELISEHEYQRGLRNNPPAGTVPLRQRADRPLPWQRNAS